MRQIVAYSAHMSFFSQAHATPSAFGLLRAAWAERAEMVEKLTPQYRVNLTFSATRDTTHQSIVTAASFWPSIY